MNYIQNKKQGATLIELLIVVAAIAAIIIGGLMVYQNYKAKEKVKDATANISNLYANINELYKRDGTASLLSNGVTELIQAGAIPNGMTEVGGVIKSVWGGDVTVEDPGLGGAFEFALLFVDIPTKETCISFVQGQVDVGWTSVTVDGNTTTMNNLTTPSLIGFCEAGGADVIDIQFTQE